MLLRYIERHLVVFVVIFGVAMFVKPDLCFVMLGLLVFYLGLTYFIFLRRLKNIGLQSPATILEYQKNKRGNSIPYVEFTTLMGEVVRS